MRMFSTAAIAAMAGMMALTATASATDFAAYKELAYADRSERNVLDIYLPESAANPPLVMWIHGGSWSQGDKGWPWGLQSFLKAGIGVAAMNYRFCPDTIWPAQLDDLRDAFAFLRANADAYGYDGTRLAAYGHSAGGQMAAVAGFVLAANPATRLKAVVVSDGPADFGRLAADAEAFALALGHTGGHTAIQAKNCLIGANIADEPDLAWRASPLSYLADMPKDTDPPAFLIVNGAEDAMATPFQSGRLFDALLARAPNTELAFELIPDAGHVSIKLQSPNLMDRIAAFLRRNFDR